MEKSGLVLLKYDYVRNIGAVHCNLFQYFTKVAHLTKECGHDQEGSEGGHDAHFKYVWAEEEAEVTDEKQHKGRDVDVGEGVTHTSLEWYTYYHITELATVIKVHRQL